MGITNRSFAMPVLAVTPMIQLTFAVIMGVDNFAIAMAGVTLVAYMSSLTSLGYTATQYALLSSTLCLGRQNPEGLLAAQRWKAMSAHIGLMNAYAVSFIGCGADAKRPGLMSVRHVDRRAPGPID